ncbi:MAG: type IV secretory system conjugative DNA transfer family protein [Gammaproteobacteria bacterium]
MVRGLERFQEQDPSKLIRDTRTLGQKVKDFLESPTNSAILLFTVALCIFFFPSASDVIALIAVFVAMYCLYIGARSKLPFRMPMRAKTKDYNDLIPGSYRPVKSRGISFFGNDKATNEELWFNNDDMRTHVLMFGSTGSGKTATLISYAYNALVQASGFIYIDGKGDNSLFAQLFSMARSLGREDDVLVINFMTGARDVIGAQESRLSNTMNPFCSGSSDMLIQLVVSLMGDSSSGSGSDGDMWKGRAITFVEAIMKILVYMRDQGKLLLDANTIRNYFHLERLEQIAIDKVFPRDDEEPVSLADAPALVLEPIYNYVMNLPGYDKKKKGKQVSQVYEQHGFITMQLTRVFGSLADTYSHIIRTNLPEVDMFDVVLNRRILVVLLPALEKSPEELSNLGKIIIATLRAMMASGLGDAVEGEFADVIQRKPTNAPTPFLCIMDEYGYYAVKGFAVVPAQARSLGFSAIFAGQDLPAFQRASKEEAASIGANTNIKICMKLEDPTETWEFFSKTAGESYVTKVDSFSTDSQSMMNNYLDTRTASAEKRARIDLLDLKDQGLGEAHVFFKSTIIRARLFYADPKIVSYMRLNHFMKVDKPIVRKLVNFENRLDEFAALMARGVLYSKKPEESPELTTVFKTLETTKQKDPIERGIDVLMAFSGVVEEEQQEEAEVKAAESEISKRLNVFARIQLHDLILKHVPENNRDAFGRAMLSKKSTQNKVSLIERYAGQASSQANNIAWEVVRDMETATDYPPVLPVRANAAEIAKLTDDLAAFMEK